MHYTFTTPPASRAADRPTPIDDALVAEARRLLTSAMGALPAAATNVDRLGIQASFAPAMATFCVRAAPGIPVEKLIVAIKLAWAAMPDARLSLGESAPDALSGAVTACIEAYFHPAPIQAD